LKTTQDHVAQRKTRIFLVDDESDILIFYKRGLEQGFLVDAFNDPVQALLAFKANKYDPVQALLAFKANKYDLVLLVSLTLALIQNNFDS
jgi:DNA-binding response OmpR family regulator